MRGQIPWQWRAVVVAPNGEALLWSIANSRYQAIEFAFEGHGELWPFAVMQGYRVVWLKEMRDV